MWEYAIEASPSVVTITTFNEWGEGTQIEPVRKVEEIEGYSKEYIDYGDDGPYKYIHLTSVYAENFRKDKSEPIRKKRKNRNRLEL
jgi:glycoprotein endo-alpha-1,2-mannosidase